MDKKYKSLLNNTAIFGIGNIVSKLAQYLIIAICTYRLTTAEFGIAEIIIQTVAMLVPVLSADIADGLFRFSMDGNYTKDQIITNALLINVAGCVLAFVTFPIEYLLTKSLHIACFITLLTLIETFQISIKEFIRGSGLTKLYMVSGFINAVVQVLACILFVYWLDFGIAGYIMILALGYIAELAFCLLQNKTLYYLRKESVSKAVLKELLAYSLPLAPNKIMWWIIAAFNRYFILWLIGASATGLYSVAAKLPAMITIVVGFFFQAWQISAIENGDANDKNQFYSDIFNLLWSTIGLITALSLIVVRYLVKILVSDAFFTSWEYAPFLLLAAAVSAIQTFLGVNYTLKKDSIGVLRSTMFAAVVNLVLNYVLIKNFGLQGATIATFITYSLVAFYRFVDTKKYVTILFDSFANFIATYGILTLECLLLSYKPELHMVTVPCFIILILINKSQCQKCIQLIVFHLKKRIAR